MSDDKITALKKSLDKFTDDFKMLKDIGINPEILKAYIAYKTKLSMKSVEAVLNSQQEFYDNLIVNAAVDNL